MPLSFNTSVSLRLSKYELLVETVNSEVRLGGVGEEAPLPNSIPSVIQIINQWHLINQTDSLMVANDHILKKYFLFF